MEGRRGSGADGATSDADGPVVRTSDGVPTGPLLQRRDVGLAYRQLSRSGQLDLFSHGRKIEPPYDRRLSAAGNHALPRVPHLPAAVPETPGGLRFRHVLGKASTAGGASSILPRGV